MRARKQVVHQTGVGTASNTAQQDEIVIIIIDTDLETFARPDLPARSYRFRYDDLASLPNTRCHQSLINLPGLGVVK